MTVKIHGNDYKTVAERVNELHAEHKECSILTELITADEKTVVIKATVTIEGKTATGYAEEVRGSNNINQTSALENCETSAVGRALAFIGYAGSEIASADEVVNAINNQSERKPSEAQLNFLRRLLDQEENQGVSFLQAEGIDKPLPSLSMNVVSGLINKLKGE